MSARQKQPPLDWLDQSIIDKIEPKALALIKEAQGYFPHPVAIKKIYWFGSKSDLLYEGSGGVGGFAYAPGEISIAYDQDYHNHDEQALALKDTVFHEYYHQMQGFVGLDSSLGDVPPIANAVYEGAASVFARDKIGSDAIYADYVDIENQLPKILEEVKLLDSNEWDYVTWKFNHPKYGRHVLYKLGVWLIDNYHSQNPHVSIEELATSKWAKIVDTVAL